MRLIRLLKNDLKAEIEDWVEEELITTSHAEKICARYGVDYHSGASSFAYRLLITLGYLFIGLALIVLIGGNWEDIPRALRMTGLIALTTVTQFAGVRLYHQQKPVAACGIFFLGNLFYGASIILIAQIYHLGEHMPDGIYWWALGCLPFALLTRNHWLMMQTLVLALIWFFLEIQFGYSTWSMPLFIAAAIYILAVGDRSLLLMLLCATAVGVYIELSVIFSIDSRGGDTALAAAFPLSAAIGLFFWTLSQWLNTRSEDNAKDYGALLELWSLRLGVVFLFIASFEFIWEELISVNFLLPLTAIVVAALTIVSAFLGIRAKRTVTTLAAIILVSGIFTIAALTEQREIGCFLQIAVNILAIIVGIRLIIRGLDHRKSQHYFLGVLTILGIGLFRYFDLIGDYLGGALLFAFFAAVLLASAKYWKRKQTTDKVA